MPRDDDWFPLSPSFDRSAWSSIHYARSGVSPSLTLRGLLSGRHGQRWLLGTHQGGVQPQHLDYLDEFTFRFNRRRSKARGLLFHRLAEQAVADDPAPYPTIIAKPSKPSASKRSGQ